MLDILEIAKEEGLKEGIREGKALGLQEGKALGLQEGKALGLQEGKALVVETTRDMVMDTLIERFNAVPTRILEQIRAIQNLDAIKGLHRQAIKCQTLQEFETILQQVI